MPASEPLEQLIARATEQLVAEVGGISAEEVTVVSTEQVEWPDTSLGCPQPGMMYAQVITPGYRIVLEAGGEEYEFHTSADPEGMIVRCEAER